MFIKLKENQSTNCLYRCVCVAAVAAGAHFASLSSRSYILLWVERAGGGGWEAVLSKPRGLRAAQIRFYVLNRARKALIPRVNFLTHQVPTPFHHLPIVLSPPSSLRRRSPSLVNNSDSRGVGVGGLPVNVAPRTSRACSTHYLPFEFI